MFYKLSFLQTQNSLSMKTKLKIKKGGPKIKTKTDLNDKQDREQKTEGLIKDTFEMQYIEFVFKKQENKTKKNKNNILPKAADRCVQVEQTADSSLGGLRLPILMLQGRGFTSGQEVPTAPVSQISPPGAPVGMGRPQATRETTNMRRVGSNNNPGMLPRAKASQNSRNFSVCCRQRVHWAM